MTLSRKSPKRPRYIWSFKSDTLALVSRKRYSITRGMSCVTTGPVDTCAVALLGEVSLAATAGSSLSFA